MAKKKLPGEDQPFPTESMPLLKVGEPFTDYTFDFSHVKKPPMASADEALVLTDDTWSTLTRINAKVNEKATYTPDERDVWNTLSNQKWKGDCEDFALEKRDQLIKAGIPASTIRMAIASTEPTWSVATNHAVLVVRTDHGDMVLNNDKGTNEIKPWQDTGYSFIALQANSDPTQFRKVTNSQLFDGAGRHNETVDYMKHQDGSTSIATATMNIQAGSDFRLKGAVFCDLPKDRPLTIDTIVTQDRRETRLDAALYGADPQGTPLRVALPTLYSRDIGLTEFHMRDQDDKPLGSLDPTTGKWTGSEPDLAYVRQQMKGVEAGLKKLGVTCDIGPEDPPLVSIPKDGTLTSSLNGTDLRAVARSAKEAIEASAPVTSISDLITQQAKARNRDF